MFEKVKSSIPLNWNLLSNPVNWVIVVLMVALAGLAVAAIFPASNNEEQ